MKKALSILILICMTLHCLSRLEVISYLYNHRHDLAFSLGITAEKVIAMCKGDHFQDVRLNQQKSDAHHPLGLAQAQEIILAFPPALLLTPNVPVEILVRNIVFYHLAEYRSPHSDIFHPPLV